MSRAARIVLQFEPGLEAAAASAGANLEKALPQLTVVYGPALTVPASALDTATGLYDAAYLLDALGPSIQGNKTLWLINRNIGNFWQGQLLGAARNDRAVVTAAMLSCGEAVAKEALHEIGHMLGLGHCAGSCCMQPSGNAAAVKNKPAAFCPACRARLEALPAG